MSMIFFPHFTLIFWLEFFIYRTFVIFTGMHRAYFCIGSVNKIFYNEKKKWWPIPLLILVLKWIGRINFHINLFWFHSKSVLRSISPPPPPPPFQNISCCSGLHSFVITRIWRCDRRAAKSQFFLGRGGTTKEIPMSSVRAYSEESKPHHV